MGTRCKIVQKYSLGFNLMGDQLVLIFGKEVALVASFFVVNFEHVRGQTFRTGRFIVTKQTHKRFGVGVQMTFQSPVIGACGENYKNTLEFKFDSRGKTDVCCFSANTSPLPVTEISI
jgi:hypothetical protein